MKDPAENVAAPVVAEAPGEQAARDQAAQQAERDLIEQRGGVTGTHNESGTPAGSPVPDSGDRNFVTGPEGGQPVLASEAEAAETAPDAGTPAHSAPKADWVEHAVSQGADREEAEGSTKADLIEKHG